MKNLTKLIILICLFLGVFKLYSQEMKILTPAMVNQDFYTNRNLQKQSDWLRARNMFLNGVTSGFPGGIHLEHASVPMVVSFKKEHSRSNRTDGAMIAPLKTPMFYNGHERRYPYCLNIVNTWTPFNHAQSYTKKDSMFIINKYEVTVIDKNKHQSSKKKYLNKTEENPCGSIYTAGCFEKKSFNDCGPIIEKFEDLQDRLKMKKRTRKKVFGDKRSKRQIKDEMIKLLYNNKKCLQGKYIYDNGKPVLKILGGAALLTGAYFLVKSIGGGSSGGDIPYKQPNRSF